MGAAVLLLPVVFGLCCLGAGLPFVRGIRWSPVERLTAAVAIALLILYAVSFLVLVLALPARAHWVIVAGCGILTLYGAAEARNLSRSPEVRRLLVAFALLALFVLSVLGLIRGYSGGLWYGDWLEHYRRSLFFLGGHPSGETFLGYALPARPPLMNVVCAHFLALADDRFRIFQIVSSLLGLLAFLPATLLAGRFSRRGEASAFVVAAFLMLNPMFVENATYSWTKLLTCFFVLAGIGFYIGGCREGSFAKTVFAFVCLAGGALTHYSAAPYALCLGLHYVARILPGRRAWPKEAAIILGVSGAILATFIGWSVWIYGLRATIASTSTVRDTAGAAPAETAMKILRNLRDTMVPTFFRRAERDPLTAGLSWGTARSAAFNLYQQNLPFALGLLGPLFLACELWKSRASDAEHPRQACGRGFWAWLASGTIAAGIAAHGTAAPLGLAHVTLQPLVLIGVAFLAARCEEWSRTMRGLLLAGLAVDLFFGIALQLWFQSAPFGTSGAWRPSTSDWMVGAGYDNWALQQQEGTVFLGTALREISSILWLLAGTAMVAAIGILARAALRQPVGGRHLR
jgi:hypothetical protein